jgi:hypothetical protein
MMAAAPAVYGGEQRSTTVEVNGPKTIGMFELAQSQG